MRKGEVGTTVVYADRFFPDEERRRPARDADQPEGISFLKRFTVFNIDQCDDLPEDVASFPPPLPEEMILPQAEALIRATGAVFRIGGDQAFSIARSRITCRFPGPTPISSQSIGIALPSTNWAHWSGAPLRLGRDLSGRFGSKAYAQEKLVAEMSSAFTCAGLGIVPTVRHADYIASWLDVLRNDDRAIVRAASVASKAADYLRGFLADAAEAPVPEAMTG